MSRIYWDSILFIYWIEAHPVFGPQTQHLHRTLVARGDKLSTSIFAVGEVLAGQFQKNDQRLIDLTEKVFDSGLITLIPVTREATRIFAILRGTTRVAPADAIHLSCAAAHGIDTFYTNDKALTRLKIPGIQSIQPLS